jgi:uncharacterized oligopeptide transporter (OPT) family protein
LGLGYIIGIRYASIIFAGSLMSYFIIVPIFAYLGGLVPTPINPGTIPIADMDAEQIFRNYARYIGIGGIFAAGLLSIMKMSPVIVKAIGIAIGEVFRKKDQSAVQTSERMEQALPMSWVFGLLVLVTLAIWVYFRFVVLSGMDNATTLSLISIVITLVISFLFISVSAWAVAMISVTPISGMTLMTLMVTAVIFSSLGMSGKAGMLATLLIGGVVCTALSMAGSLVTQYKVGYWLGSTPRKIELANIGGSILSSIVVTAVIILLAQVYGFSERAPQPVAQAVSPPVVQSAIPDSCALCEGCVAGRLPESTMTTADTTTPVETTTQTPETSAPITRDREPLPAPQANAMAAVLGSIFGAGGAPWFLYAMGALIAVLVFILGISPLAFALGMYLPIELNSPIMAGAIVGWLVQKSSKDEKLSKARHDKGILIASGLIAGGALIGVIDALIKFIQDKYSVTIIPDLNNTGALGNWLGLGLFLLLAGFLYWDARQAKGE